MTIVWSLRSFISMFIYRLIAALTWIAFVPLRNGETSVNPPVKSIRVGHLISIFVSQTLVNIDISKVIVRKVLKLSISVNIIKKHYLNPIQTLVVSFCYNLADGYYYDGNFLHSFIARFGVLRLAVSSCFPWGWKFRSK